VRKLVRKEVIYIANAVQMTVGKNWREVSRLYVIPIGLRAFPGHHLRKRYEAIRRATEVTTVAFSDQDAMLPAVTREQPKSVLLDQDHGMR
jgi:hypothetical protein